MARSATEVFRQGWGQVAHINDDDLPTASQQQARNFEQLCDDMAPGGADAYLVCRFMSNGSLAPSRPRQLQGQIVETYKSHGVGGWTRGLNSGACQLCQWWSRDRQVWPLDHRMPTHKGCGCYPVPVA